VQAIYISRAFLVNTVSLRKDLSVKNRGLRLSSMKAKRLIMGLPFRTAPLNQQRNSRLFGSVRTDGKPFASKRLEKSRYSNIAGTSKACPCGCRWTENRLHAQREPTNQLAQSRKPIGLSYWLQVNAGRADVSFQELPRKW
jgi:hypothetical protein